MKENPANAIVSLPACLLDLFYGPLLDFAQYSDKGPLYLEAVKPAIYYGANVRYSLAAIRPRRRLPNESGRQPMEMLEKLEPIYDKYNGEKKA